MKSKFRQIFAKKPSVKVTIIAAAVVVAIGAVAFLLANTKAWQGNGAVFPTENPPANVSNDSVPSKEASIATQWYPSYAANNLAAVWADATLIKYGESIDSGQTWSSAIEITGADASISHTQPDIAYSSSGLRHVTYRNNDGKIMYIKCASDCNISTNWSTPIEIGGIQDPAIAAYGDTVVIVWSAGDRGYSRKSADAGDTWGATKMLPGSWHLASTDPDIAVDSNGTWAVSFFQSDGNGSTNLLGATSTDGESWENVITLDLTSEQWQPDIFKPAIAALPFSLGNFYTAYQFNTQTIANPFMVIKAVSWTSGAIVTAPVIVSDPNVQAFNPAITSDTNGYVHATWQSIAQ